MLYGEKKRLPSCAARAAYKSMANALLPRTSASRGVAAGGVGSSVTELGSLETGGTTAVGLEIVVGTTVTSGVDVGVGTTVASGVDVGVGTTDILGVDVGVGSTVTLGADVSAGSTVTLGVGVGVGPTVALSVGASALVRSEVAVICGFPSHADSVTVATKQRAVTDMADHADRPNLPGPNAVSLTQCSLERASPCSLVCHRTFSLI